MVDLVRERRGVDGVLMRLADAAVCRLEVEEEARSVEAAVPELVSPTMAYARGSMGM